MNKDYDPLLCEGESMDPDAMVLIVDYKVRL